MSGPVRRASRGRQVKEAREEMNRRGLILIFALVVLVAASLAADDDGERRSGSGRKRSRGTSAFRPDANARASNIPLDPLFTDQREIRLTFTKVNKSFGTD